MNTSAIISDSRVRRVRELERELAEARAARASAEDALAAALARGAEIALALADAARAKAAGASRIVAIDGHNVLFARPCRAGLAEKERRRALTRDVAAYAARRADAIVWLVYDGAGASGEASGNFRVSYSGGEGAHRADRLITDYLRAALLAGAALPAEVATSDRDLAAAAAKLGAAVRGAKEFIAEMEMEA